MKKYMTWGGVPVLVFGILAFFFWRGLSLHPNVLPLAQLNQALPAFEMPVLGHETHRFSSDNMRGHPAILHVFASWCDVCADEQMVLLKLADQGIALYGLNYKDDAFDAMRWLQTWGNPYRLIGVDEAGKAGIDLGVYGTPETFLIDSKGMIRYRHVGALSQSTWDEVLRPQWEALS